MGLAQGRGKKFTNGEGKGKGCAMRKAILILGVLALAPVMAEPITVGFSPSSSSVLPGESFTVSILADIPEPVLGWGLDVSFDSSVLNLTGVSVGADWVPVVGIDGDELSGLAFPFPVSGEDIVLAELSFKRKGNPKAYI